VSTRHVFLVDGHVSEQDMAHWKVSVVPGQQFGYLTL